MSFTVEDPKPYTWQCEPCSKRAWSQKAHAKEHARRLGARFGRKFKVYRCTKNTLGGYHLTTQGRRGKEGLHAVEVDR